MNKKIIRQNLKNEVRQIKSNYFEFQKDETNSKILIQEKKYTTGLEIKKTRLHHYNELQMMSKYTKIFLIIAFAFLNMFHEIGFNFSNYKFIKNIRKENMHTIKFAGNSNRMFILNKILQMIFLILMAIIILFPFYWMLNISFTPDEYLLAGDVPPFFPTHWSFQPYNDLINYINQSDVYVVSLWRIIGNTFIVTIVSVLVQLVISLTAGFAIANFKNIFTKIISIIFIATLAIPGESLILGQLIFMKQIGMDNTFIALIVPFAANVLGIYLIAKAFENIPPQLKKASKIDGLSNMKYFFKIAIPHIKYTIMIVTLFAIISSWNSLLWPTTVLNSDSNWVTLPMLLWGLIDPENLPPTSLENPINLKMAGTIISTIPMLVLCVVFNKLFIRGNENTNT